MWNVDTRPTIYWSMFSYVVWRVTYWSVFCFWSWTLKAYIPSTKKLLEQHRWIPRTLRWMDGDETIMDLLSMYDNTCVCMYPDLWYPTSVPLWGGRLLAHCLPTLLDTTGTTFSTSTTWFLYSNRRPTKYRWRGHFRTVTGRPTRRYATIVEHWGTLNSKSHVKRVKSDGIISMYGPDSGWVSTFSFLIKANTNSSSATGNSLVTMLL